MRLYALCCLICVVVACRGGPQLTYRLTGTAAQANVLYRNGRGDMVQLTVDLPWEKTIGVQDGSQYEVNVDTAGGGTVACAVWLGDEEVGSVSGATFAECRGSYRDGETSFRGRFDVPGGAAP